MSTISTHVLDTATGKPAVNISVRLFQADREIAHVFTDANGRCPSILPPELKLAPGVFRLLFDVTSRFPDGFFPEVSVTFIIRDAASHYHVPLLISPFGYTTYRGS
jgi:5-hydroxyisourate hydrolase